MRPARHAIAAAVFGLALVAPQGAVGQSNDPPANSPSGAIYEIPLEGARGDGAPSGGGGSGGGGGGESSASAPGAQQESRVHSPDNGFGSSAQVPGTSGQTSGGLERRSSGASATHRTTSKDKSGGSAARKSSGSDDDSADAQAERLIRGPSAVTTAAPSKSRAYLLLVLAPLVAVALGLAVRRRSSR